VSPVRKRTASIQLDPPKIISNGWWSIYDSIAATGVALIKFGGLFHKKLGRAVAGRKGGVNRWNIEFADTRPAILIHAASRGEFESIIPLIDGLVKQNKCRIAVSYSSPSVEKTVQDFPGLWTSGYLPFDQMGEQLRFLSRLNPALILVAKHDIWPNMIRAATALRIPYILINANFHSGTRRGLPFVKRFNRQFFGLIREIWTISDDDAARISPIFDRSDDLHVVGDTRYDRTISRAVVAREKFAPLKVALGIGPVIVAGSTWPPEEQIVIPAFASFHNQNPTAKLVIAPHELGQASLERCNKAILENGLKLKLFSNWQGEPLTDEVLYIDRMGVLADIYSVGWAAVVGGGFGVGVHSVLEPAAHGLPVAYGPNHHVSHEAGLLMKSGGGSLLTDAASLSALWQSWIETPATYHLAVEAASEVVSSNSGATNRLMKRLEPYLRQK